MTVAAKRLCCRVHHAQAARRQGHGDDWCWAAAALGCWGGAPDWRAIGLQEGRVRWVIASAHVAVICAREAPPCSTLQLRDGGARGVRAWNIVWWRGPARGEPPPGCQGVGSKLRARTRTIRWPIRLKRERRIHSISCSFVAIGTDQHRSVPIGTRRRPVQIGTGLAAASAAEIIARRIDDADNAGCYEAACGGVRQSAPACGPTLDSDPTASPPSYLPQRTSSRHGQGFGFKSQGFRVWVGEKL